MGSQVLKLSIERTTSFQVENEKGEYCLTAYSRHDALLGMSLAEGITGLKCLGKGRDQPKGIYVFMKDPKTGESFPEIEIYDKRLASRVRQNIDRFKGDFKVPPSADDCVARIEQGVKELEAGSIIRGVRDFLYGVECLLAEGFHAEIQKALRRVKGVLEHA